MLWKKLATGIPEEAADCARHKNPHRVCQRPMVARASQVFDLPVVTEANCRLKYVLERCQSKINLTRRGGVTTTGSDTGCLQKSRDAPHSASQKATAKGGVRASWCRSDPESRPYTIAYIIIASLRGINLLRHGGRSGMVNKVYSGILYFCSLDFIICHCWFLDFKIHYIVKPTGIR